MDHCFVVKVCILGDSSVGKSSIALRFVENAFRPDMESTIGAAFLQRSVSANDGNLYRLQIWDTAGQERYKALTPMYYRGAAIILLVYDITKRETLVEGVQEWIREIKQKGPADTNLILVGNKLDKAEDEREVETAEARKYAENIGAMFYEASAKTGLNVTDIFMEACSRLENNSNLSRCQTPTFLREEMLSDSNCTNHKQKKQLRKRKFPFRKDRRMPSKPVQLQFHGEEKYKQDSCCTT